MVIEDLFFSVILFLLILVLLHEADVLLHRRGGRRGTGPA